MPGPMSWRPRRPWASRCFMFACSSAGGARRPWFGLALLMGRLPRTGGYRVIAGRDVKVSVLHDAGESRSQPVQIDGDNALTLPVSIAIASGAVRLLRPA